MLIFEYFYKFLIQIINWYSILYIFIFHLNNANIVNAPHLRKERLPESRLLRQQHFTVGVVKHHLEAVEEIVTDDTGSP